MRSETRYVHFDAAPGDRLSPTVTPIYQTATFRQPSATEFGEYDYTRSGNPTRRVLEQHMASIEGGAQALAFSSGMAALTATVSLVKAGEEIVACRDIYGGTYRMFTRVLPRQGITVRFVDTTRPEAVEEALVRNPRLVLLETPTNPLQRITDIAHLAARVHERDGLLAVDNSLMSPYLQQPLDAGADIVIHSATKYLGGHSDVTAGVVVTRTKSLAREIAFYQNAAGTAVAPFEAWLLLRGLKTLALRIDRQQATADRVARFLASHPLVRKVRYAGLADHPGRDVHFRQARGAGGVLSFETGSVEFSRELVERTKLFAITVSFGGVASSISMPAYMSHASIPKDVRHASGLPEDLVRVSVGIEHVDDLVEDLTAAIEGAAAHLAVNGSGARHKNADVAEPGGGKVERGNE